MRLTLQYVETGTRFAVFKIVAQSDRHTNFRSSFTNMYLSCVSCPEVSGHTIYLRGNDDRKDDKPLAFPKEDLKDYFRTLNEGTQLQVRLL